MQGLKPGPLSFITPEGIEWANILHDQRVQGDCLDAVAYPFVQAYLPDISGTCQNDVNQKFIQEKNIQGIKVERKEVGTNNSWK